MVSVMWAVIAASSGLLAYFLPAIVAQLLPPAQRAGVGRWYFKQAQRSFRNTAIVWRELGGPELLPIGVNDEQRSGEVTLSSGIIGNDQKLPFKDPDDRIHRLHSKPLAVIPRRLPAAVDAELCEIAHHTREHELNSGLETKVDDETKIDPWVPVSQDLRLVNPLDVLYATTKSVEPENIETTKQLTRERFSKYGTPLGAAETLGTIMGFGVGAGAIAGFQYLKQNTLSGGGGGGGGTTLPLQPGQVVVDHAPVVLDTVVTIL